MPEPLRLQPEPNTAEFFENFIACFSSATGSVGACWFHSKLYIRNKRLASKEANSIG